MKIERYKKDIDALVLKGQRLRLSLLIELQPDETKKRVGSNDATKDLPDVRDDYQAWYSEALALVRQLLPDRVDDFIGYYKPLKPRKELNASTYTISDFLQGITVTRGGQTLVSFNAAAAPLHQQVLIVESLAQRFESSLFDIRALVQADILDNELEVAEELNKKGFARAAGAVAGVALEEHLATVVQQHKITSPKNPSISDLNDLLKKNDVVEISTWRFIQHLGDLRNLCDHKKETDPTREKIAELIDGARKIVKTVF